MLKYLEKYRTLIAILLILALLATFLFLPVHMQLVSMVILFASIGVTVIMLFQKHVHSYQNAECTREKMTRNLFLDLLGMFLTLGVAMYAGGLAGTYFGLHAGFPPFGGRWFGLVAGFIVGFIASWVVRSVWGKLVRVA